MSASSTIVLITGAYPFLPTQTSHVDNVILQGANSGVGLATSKVFAFASSGYHVIMGSRSSEKGNAAVGIVKSGGIKGSISTIQLDVKDESSIAAAVKMVEKDHGRLDVLINNAGVYSKAQSLKSQLAATFNANVIGPTLVTEAFLPLLLKSSNPYLLHISSTLGSLTLSSDPQRFDYGLDAQVYRMSKAALNMLTLQHSKVLGEQGVKVFAVCPGLVESGLRGQEEEERTMGGKAGSPEVSGQTILKIVQGDRDADKGKFVHKDGVYPW